LDVELYDPKRHYNRVRNRWSGTSIGGE